MAAYGALVSLMHIIEQLQHHPRPPITLDKAQAQSLTETIAFLQEFFERYSHGSSQEADVLQSCIRDAAYAAEDIIESHVVDQILAQSTTHGGDKISSVDLHKGLQKVIEDMDSIRKEVMEIKDKLRIQDPQHTPVVSSRSPSGGKDNTMVGFDDLLKETIDKLTGGEEKREIIPIVGMGGIGKTTLARNVYENSITISHFEVRAWVTISQEHNVQEILLELLLCQKDQGSRDMLRQMEEKELGHKLYQSLFGRRYLIILDDIWSNELWERIRLHIPVNKNGSRIIITTRDSKVASNLTGSVGPEMKFLDEIKSWDLLRRTVFGEKSCPDELVETGKKIAKECNGLPLSIVVIAGALKSNWALSYWNQVAKNLNLIVGDDKSCFNILNTSYNLLPAHLKPCFLYMGIFPEDSEINVSELLKMWVAEGFLKPVTGKSLEVVAEECLSDLIDKNLVRVRKWGSLSQKVKSCSMHDLLRDLCLKEAQKDKFLCVTIWGTHGFLEGVSTQRRVSVHRRPTPMKVESSAESSSESSSSVTRSFICDFVEVLPSFHFRFLRILKTVEGCSLDDIFQLVNSRYITCQRDDLRGTLPSAFSLLWNLQTRIVTGSNDNVVAPAEIWKMPLLRHVKLHGLYLPDPPSCQTEKQDRVVLANLQTLLKVMDFNCSEEVVKRIPNVKKLKACYMDIEEEFEVASEYYLSNLGRLDKLESLGLFFTFNTPSRSDLIENLTFPHSLNKLTLYGTGLHWEDMSDMIGSLPHLQVLKLQACSFMGAEWETDEGQFRSLRHLLISYCDDLEYWRTESNHFPLLEHLSLEYLPNLREIPSEIGDTLQSIQLENCSVSAVVSAKQIINQQEEYGNKDLRVRVLSTKQNDLLQSLASHNFQVIFRTW